MSEMESGLKLLQENVATGKINDVIQAYENDEGDYLFIVAEKI